MKKEGEFELRIANLEGLIGGTLFLSNVSTVTESFIFAGILALVPYPRTLIQHPGSARILMVAGIAREP